MNSNGNLFIDLGLIVNFLTVQKKALILSLDYISSLESLFDLDLFFLFFFLFRLFLVFPLSAVLLFEVEVLFMSSKSTRVTVNGTG